MRLRNKFQYIKRILIPLIPMQERIVFRAIRRKLNFETIRVIEKKKKDKNGKTIELDISSPLNAELKEIERSSLISTTLLLPPYFN